LPGDLAAGNAQIYQHAGVRKLPLVSTRLDEKAF
jgi:hypothetical protein